MPKRFQYRVPPSCPWINSATITHNSTKIYFTTKRIHEKNVCVLASNEKRNKNKKTMSIIHLSDVEIPRVCIPLLCHDKPHWLGWLLTPFVLPYYILYFYGPRWGAFGFYQGESFLTICESMTGMQHLDWSKTQVPCIDLISRRFSAFVIGVWFMTVFLLCLALLV